MTEFRARAHRWHSRGCRCHETRWNELVFDGVQPACGELLTLKTCEHGHTKSRLVTGAPEQQFQQLLSFVHLLEPRFDGDAGALDLYRRQRMLLDAIREAHERCVRDAVARPELHESRSRLRQHRAIGVAE